MPLLQKAANANEAAKVMTVLSGPIDGAIDLQDLGLKRTYSLGNAAQAGSAYNNLMIQVSHWLVLLIWCCRAQRIYTELRGTKSKHSVHSYITRNSSHESHAWVERLEAETTLTAWLPHRPSCWRQS